MVWTDFVFLFSFYSVKRKTSDMSRNSFRCYQCGGVGHVESQCLAVPTRPGHAFGRIRRARPAFAFDIRALDEVSMRDIDGTEILVAGFGVETIGESLRVARTGDRISFFGRQTTGRNFSVSLPTNRAAIPFQWDGRRLSCGGIFGMNAGFFKVNMGAVPETPAQSEFALMCTGEFTREFIIRFWFDENEVEYRAIQNGRGSMCIAPMSIYDGINEYRNLVTDGENIEVRENETEDEEQERDENANENDEEN